jgi:hypothetical protein
MDDVRADYPEDDQPDDMDEPHRVEPKSRRAGNFIDDDEFEGEEVDLTQRPPMTYANTAFAGGPTLPPLPANLQRIKDLFDMMATQKEMVGPPHAEKDRQSEARSEQD